MPGEEHPLPTDDTGVSHEDETSEHSESKGNSSNSSVDGDNESRQIVQEQSFNLIGFVPSIQYRSAALLEIYRSAPPSCFYQNLLGIDPNAEVNLFPEENPQVDQPEVVLENVPDFFPLEGDNMDENHGSLHFGRGDHVRLPIHNPEEPEAGASQSEVDRRAQPKSATIPASMLRRQRRRGCSHFNNPYVVDTPMANRLANALEDFGENVWRNLDQERYHRLFHVFDEFRFQWPTPALQPEFLSSNLMDWSQVAIPTRLEHPQTVTPVNFADQIYADYGNRVAFLLYRLHPTEMWMEKLMPIEPRMTEEVDATEELQEPLVTLYGPIEETAWMLATGFIMLILMFKLVFIFIMNYVVFHRH